jgi:hypothetical protein
MVRQLTANERAVLAHKVADPDAWWEHASKPERKTPGEDALAAKVGRWQGEYDVESAKPGYQTAAERTGEDDVIKNRAATVVLTPEDRAMLEAVRKPGTVDMWVAAKLVHGGQASLDEALANMRAVR